MSYQVLARKWRPRHFKDMIGQEYILRMLSNALDQNRLHHAYLFSGTRGVGKTTLGRILAKCLNCEKNVTSSPCNECNACKSIDAGRFLDLYEIDAASRTKVEDTRELLDNVLYTPTQGRYKIYLIDEVHMLSNHSFNALLKTLEEPPEHVKFILATTDPKRLPITILSRCLQFNLKKIIPSQITQHLQSICQAEAITNEVYALEKIAKAADGSMRDALSLLDQAIGYGNGQVTVKDVNTMLGNIEQDDLLPLVNALATQNGKQLFDAIAHFSEHAPHFQQALDELISLLHQLAIIQIIPDAIVTTEAIKTLAQQFTPEDIQLYYQIALLGKRDLNFTPNPQQGFEMIMLRMLAFKPNLNKSIEKTSSHSQQKPMPSAESKNTKVSVPAPEFEATPTSSAVTPISANEWRQILSKLGLSGMAYALAANCNLQKMSENKITLALSANHQPMLNQKLQERITEALTRHFKQPIQLDIVVTSIEISTPLKQQQSEQKELLNDATNTIMQHPQIKQLIDMYDATVEVSLLT